MTERLAEVTKKIAKLKRAGQCRGRRPTVPNNAVNYSESSAWGNTAECREAKLTRAIERRRNTGQIDPEHCRIRASTDAVQPSKKSHMINQVINERNQTCLWGITNSEHGGKRGSFLDPSKRLVQFRLHNFCCKFLRGRQAEVSCQLAVSDFCCGVNLLRKLSLSSCLAVAR